MYEGPKAAYSDSSLFTLVTTSSYSTPFVHTTSRSIPDLVTSTVQLQVGEILTALIPIHRFHIKNSLFLDAAVDVGHVTTSLEVTGLGVGPVLHEQTCPIIPALPPVIACSVHVCVAPCAGGTGIASVLGAGNSA